MEKAWFFAAGAAVCFVLGTRYGRQTYEKMRDQSLEAWHNLTVQEKVGGATETLKDMAPKVQQKAGALAKKITPHGTDTSVTTAPTTGVPLETCRRRARTSPLPAGSRASAEGPLPARNHRCSVLRS